MGNESQYVKVVDGSNIGDPQTLAMLQAFYSRSPMPIDERLDYLYDGTTSEERLRNALNTYYIGYGHDSIGQLGNFVLFIENCSILAAKAIQDNPLYRGQECSTRYIDFRNQPFLAPPIHEPLVRSVAGAVFREQREFYLEALQYFKESIRATITNPLDVIPENTPPEKIDAVYERTVNAMAFDQARGFLPAGAMTSLAWATDFDTANKHLAWMSRHPLDEVVTLAKMIHEVLIDRYPSAIKPWEALSSLVPSQYYQADYYTDYHKLPKPERAAYRDIWSLNSYKRTELLNIERRRGEALPRVVQDAGWLDMILDLDYGSFRDIQRHRRGKIRMPLLTEDLGMHRFYTSRLSSALLEKSEALTRNRNVLKLHMHGIDYQYFVPMAYTVRFSVQWDVAQTVYVTELRSGTSVHPTLRRLMHLLHIELAESGQKWERDLADLIKTDDRPDYANRSRGMQTILGPGE